MHVALSSILKEKVVVIIKNTVLDVLDFLIDLPPPAFFEGIYQNVSVRN